LAAFLVAFLVGLKNRATYGDHHGVVRRA
jgi:hypothetical protein